MLKDIKKPTLVILFVTGTTTFIYSFKDLSVVKSLQRTFERRAILSSSTHLLCPSLLQLMLRSDSLQQWSVKH